MTRPDGRERPAGDFQPGDVRPAGALRGVAPALGLIVAFLVGLALGVVAGFQHLAIWRTGPISWPIGLVAALLGLAVLVRLAGLMTGRRSVAVAAFVGWLILTIALMVVRPGHDVILGDTWTSYVYLFGGVFSGAVLLSLPAVPLRDLGQPPQASAR